MTSTQLGGDNTERLWELAARIAAEQDHDKFTALVKGLRKLSAASGKDFKLGVLLYDAEQTVPFGERMFVLGIDECLSSQSALLARTAGTC